MASESQAQKNLPSALPTEMMLTSEAAVTAVTPETVCAIGAASVMIAMPAVTLRKSSAHSANHCHVFRAPPRS
jgi:hypothetical protein